MQQRVTHYEAFGTYFIKTEFVVFLFLQHYWSSCLVLR